MRASKHVVAIGMVLAFLLTGCTAQPDTPAENTPPPSAEAAPGDTEEPSGAVESYDPEDAVATQEVPVPGSAEDTVTVSVFPLEVKGDVQVLHFVVTPHFQSVREDDEINLSEMIESLGIYPGPQLIDMENLKVYSVIHPAGEWWMSDEFTTKTTNGRPVAAWAVFAAPEDDVDSFEVRMHESWPAFTEVPVQR